MSDSQNTSAATLLSCEHSRQRRAERLVSKRDLQAAIKYGSRVPSLNQRGQLAWKYSFADVVFIVDQSLTKEITCWAKPGAGLDVEKQHITSEMESAHQAARTRLQNNCSWTSHTVVVVACNYFAQTVAKYSPFSKSFRMFCGKKIDRRPINIFLGKIRKKSLSTT